MLEDCLDDLAVRFLLHLPEADTATFDRLGFHLEQAYWFYCDICQERHPEQYPAMSMRTFVRALLERCRLHGHTFPACVHAGYAGYAGTTGGTNTGGTNTGTTRTTSTLDEQLAMFNRYKAAVPVCGTALVSATGDKVLMVKGVGRSSRWGFPKGKINKDEHPWQCAKRECYEECGFAVGVGVGVGVGGFGGVGGTGGFGGTGGTGGTQAPTHGTQAHGTPTPTPTHGTPDGPPHIDALLDGKPVRIYVVLGVSEETKFAPRTRNEIGAIAWHLLADLPTKRQHPNSRLYHHVVPFVKRILQIASSTGMPSGMPSGTPSVISYGPLSGTPSGISYGTPSGISYGISYGTNGTPDGTLHGTPDGTLHGPPGSGTRVSIGELMRRSALAVPPVAPTAATPTAVAPTAAVPPVIIDSDDSSSTTSTSSDTLQEMQAMLHGVVPVWTPTADSASLLRLLTGGTGTGDRLARGTAVSREECVRQISERIPEGGLDERALGGILALL